MGAIATFDYAAWQARYPELAYVSSSLATSYFAEAGLYLNNAGQGPVCDVPTQTLLMNMLTAHIAALNAPTPSGQPNPTIVGRISSAGEGSVNVSSENNYPPGSPQWFQQTKYGSAFWAATQQYRTMHYMPGPVRNMQPFPWGLGLPGIFRR